MSLCSESSVICYVSSHALRRSCREDLRRFIFKVATRVVSSGRTFSHELLLYHISSIILHSFCWKRCLQRGVTSFFSIQSFICFAQINGWIWMPILVVFRGFTLRPVPARRSGWSRAGAGQIVLRGSGYLGSVDRITRVTIPIFAGKKCPQILRLYTYRYNQLHPISWTSK